MRKWVKMIGVIAGILGMLSAVYVLIVFMSQVRYILAWNSNSIVQRVGRQYEIPVKVWILSALVIFSQFGLYASLLRAKKGGIMAAFLAMTVYSSFSRVRQ